MAAVSGQNNAYEFYLHNGLDSSPVEHIWIHTDRAQVAGNYITLGIPDALKVKAALAPVQSYVERLRHLGACLVTWNMPYYCDEVLAGRAHTGDIAPSHIKVSKYLDARRVIGDLFAHNEMSVSDRAGMEDALRELEKSAQFANKSEKFISTAQIEVIQSAVSPYIDDIKSVAPDSQTAKDWVKSASNALIICGPNIKGNLPSILWTSCKSGHDKDSVFYESLFAITQIYSSMGDLESTLERLGGRIPSKPLVQQAVLDLFD